MSAFDPPRVFDDSRQVALRSTEAGYIYPGAQAIYAIHARDVLLVPTTGPGEVVVYHATTGETLRQLTFDAIPNRHEQTYMTELDGEVQLFTAFFHHEPGTGTAVDKVMLRVQRHSLTGGETKWSVDIAVPLPASLSNIDIVAATADHVVISARERGGPGAEISRNTVAVVLDSATGGVRWIRERFIPYAVSGDVIAGTTPKPDRTEEPNKVEARHARTEQVVWTFAGYNIDRNDKFGHPVGDNLVQINTDNGMLGDGRVFTTHLVDIATGRTGLKLEHPDAFDCTHDRATLIVCQVIQSNTPSVVGFNASSYQQLWTIDSNAPGRLVPDVKVAYKGVLYAQVDGDLLGRAAILDGQTGNDLTGPLPIAPIHVGPGYALAYDRGRLRLYLASG